MPPRSPHPETTFTNRSKISLTGQIEKITFRNSKNNYTIARLRVHRTEALITVIGYLPGAQPGETVKLTGEWETHPRFGEQFRVDLFEVMLPETVEGIRQYLSSGLIKGVGPKTVSRIVDCFGKETLTVIEKSPLRLTEIKGLGPKTAERIGDAWRQQHVVRQVMEFLQDNQLSTAYCSRLVSLYSDETIQILTQNPYQIALDWPRMGFKIADAIAVNRGLAKDDPDRARACLLHQVTLDADEGHTLADEENLIQRCHSGFDVSRDCLDNALGQLCGDDALVVEMDLLPNEGRAVYLKKIHLAELGIVEKLDALRWVPMPPLEIDHEWMAEKIVKKLAISLSDEQRDVLAGLLNHRVSVLTGGPGTGKTTLIRSLSAIFTARKRHVVLTAPTGRASKRLAEVSGQSATTIHRLLSYNVHTGLFDKNRDDPLDADVIIVDEASMVDTLLMHHLLDAVHLNAAVIFVGDVYQLPPVGPGNVLADLIETEIVPTFELTQVFRQAQQSPIITNAHRIRMGQPPELKLSDEIQTPSDFYFIETGNPPAAVETIGKLCMDRIPKQFGFDPIEDIQIITPMHKGDVGTINLNRSLQKWLNPYQSHSASKIGSFREGDKVMHLKNNYSKDVFNGDIGRVDTILSSDGSLIVDYEGRRVEYDSTELQELTLAYAISVHKSQGSEYPAVILPLFTQHYPLLQRNLLYTAITRGKYLVIIIGTTRAVEIALANNTPRQRLSGLALRLKRLE